VTVGVDKLAQNEVLIFNLLNNLNLGDFVPNFIFNVYFVSVLNESD